jgi:CheY-like chemotaxis protein
MALSIRHFRHQHRELLELADRLTRILGRPSETDAEEMRLAIERLAAHVRHHLDAEDHGLYVELRRSPDQNARLLASSFEAQMGDLAGTFAAYVKAWSRKHIQSDPRGFDAATRAMVAALRTRIDQEERLLYPLADGISVLASQGACATGRTDSLVFVVDDNDGDFVLLQEAWLEIGVPCTFAHFGAARELLQRVAEPTVPDLLVIDINLPIIAGTELVRTLRTMPRNRKIPIVMCSSGAASGDHEKAMACGATGFFPKPATFDEYLPFVRAMNDLIAYHCGNPGDAHRPSASE